MQTPDSSLANISLQLLSDEQFSLKDTFGKQQKKTFLDRQYWENYHIPKLKHEIVVWLNSNELLFLKVEGSKPETSPFVEEIVASIQCVLMSH